MRSEENIHALMQCTHRPHALGFIFYERSPRYAGTLRDDYMRTLATHIPTIGVFVHATEEEILENVQRFHLHAVQLHGEETPMFCYRLKQHLIALTHHHNYTYTSPPQLWKAIHIREHTDIMMVAEFDSVIDCALLDTRGKEYGGNGVRFDWSILDSYPSRTIPFLLSGGIRLEHSSEVHNALLRYRPLLRGVDINSCFEIAPAVKDITRISTFVRHLSKRVS